VMLSFAIALYGLVPRTDGVIAAALQKAALQKAAVSAPPAAPPIGNYVCTIHINLIGIDVTDSAIDCTAANCPTASQISQWGSNGTLVNGQRRSCGLESPRMPPSPSLPPKPPPSPDSPPAPPPWTTPPSKSECPGCDKGGCFDKDQTRACKLLSSAANIDTAYAECFGKPRARQASLPSYRSAELVLMSALRAGDLVLDTSTSSSRIIVNQHAETRRITTKLTFHTADSSISMTPDHGVFVNGVLMAASQVRVGARLTTGAVVWITKAESAIINPVTASGTILACDTGAPILAASHPIWIASIVVDSTVTRILVNAALLLAGEAESISSGVASAVTRLTMSIVIGATAARALRKRKASSA